MRRSFLTAVLSVVLFALSSSAAMAQREEICANTPVPAGWIKVTDRNSFFKCGNPISPFVLNVWVIERHDNKFRGATMVACDAPQPPAGWVIKNRFWDPLSCGHPSAVMDNMMIIECLNCPLPPPPPPPTGPDYEGWIDVTNCDTIAGWVWNKRAPNEPLRIDILANGTQVAQVMADVFRQDLKNSGKGDGRHGFSFPTPARLKNSQNISITVRVTNTSFFLPNGPKTFNCANPIDDARFFVRQHYFDFLGREPDQAGLDFWANQIIACGADTACRKHRRIQVSKAFFVSIEFQNTGYYVHRFYRASFARMPTLAEFGADNALVSQGVIVGTPGWESTLSFNKVAFASTFAARSNFTSVYNALNNQQFVDRLFANAQVTPEAAFRNDLIDGLNTNRYSRAEALRRIVEYQRFIDREFNPAFVTMQYMGYLRRHPSDPPDGPSMPGYFFWLNELNKTGDQNHMVDAFISSIEYRNRFGSDQPWPSGSTTKMQAAQLSRTTVYEPIPPCEDWNGDGWCDPPSCEDWDGDGDWDYCG